MQVEGYIVDVGFYSLIVVACQRRVVLLLARLDVKRPVAFLGGYIQQAVAHRHIIQVVGLLHDDVRLPRHGVDVHQHGLRLAVQYPVEAHRTLAEHRRPVVALRHPFFEGGLDIDYDSFIVVVGFHAGVVVEEQHHFAVHRRHVQQVLAVAHG